MVIREDGAGHPRRTPAGRGSGPTVAAARALAAQRNFLNCENTARARIGCAASLMNRAPPSRRWSTCPDGPQLRLTGIPRRGHGSVADARAAGRRSSRAGRRAARDEALVRSTASSTRPDASGHRHEDRAVRLSRAGSPNSAGIIDATTAEISALLEGDDTYRCLLTVPGSAPKPLPSSRCSADIEDFPSHDRLASYCGGAAQPPVGDLDFLPVTASRQGNKRLKNLAHILVQLPYPDRGKMGRLLR